MSESFTLKKIPFQIVFSLFRWSTSSKCFSFYDHGFKIIKFIALIKLKPKVQNCRKAFQKRRLWLTHLLCGRDLEDELSRWRRIKEPLTLLMKVGRTRMVRLSWRSSQRTFQTPWNYYCIYIKNNLCCMYIIKLS